MKQVVFRLMHLDAVPICTKGEFGFKEPPHEEVKFS